MILKVKNYLIILAIGIFGNKSDLINQEEVDENEVRAFAKQINALFQRTSARNGTGINDSVIKLINNYVKDNVIQNDNKRLDLKKSMTQAKSGCC